MTKQEIANKISNSYRDKNNLKKNNNETNIDDIITRPYPIFDFSLPNRIQLEQIRTLKDLHEKITRTLSSRITAILNMPVDISLAGVDQMQYNEFTMSLSTPTSFNIISMKPLEGHIALELNYNVASSFIDILLGGSGNEKGNPKEFTEIELEILQYILKIFLQELKTAWEPITLINFFLENKENSYNNVQIAAQNEVVVVVTYFFKSREEQGHIQICYPVIYLEPILGKLLSKSLLPTSYRKKTRHNEIKALLSGTKMDFDILLFEDKINLLNILDLKKGSIITSNIKPNDYLIGRVNNKQKFNVKYGQLSDFKAATIEGIFRNEQIETVKILKEIERSRIEKHNKILEDFKKTEADLKKELK